MSEEHEASERAAFRTPVYARGAMTFTTGFVFGRPGSGKSTLLRALVLTNARRQDAYHKFVVYDSTREWAGFPGTLPDQVLILPSYEWSLEEAAHEALTREATLVVDECEQHLPNRGVRELPRCVSAIVYRGRHYNAALLCATQRPGKVHQSIFAHAGVVFGFRLTLHADLDRVRRELGSEVAQEVAELEPFEYVRYDM